MNTKPFKFLSEDLSPNDSYSACWTFVDHNILSNNFDLIRENHYGIMSFLNSFPNYYIVPVVSIIGLDDVVHNIQNQGLGWGFDIRTDLISVTWVRFRD